MLDLCFDYFCSICVGKCRGGIGSCGSANLLVQCLYNIEEVEV